MKKIILLSLTLINLFAFVLPAAYAKPKVVTETNYYEIHGDSKRDLFKAMKKSGPESPQGKKFFAYTKWDVSYSFHFGRMGFGAGCFLANAGTDVKIEYTMPQWDSSEGSASLQKSWNDFYERLLFHEEGHGQIAIDAAHEMEEAFKKVKPMPKCELLGAEVKRAAESILEKYRKKEIKYDKDTDHGKTQGAVL